MSTRNTTETRSNKVEKSAVIMVVGASELWIVRDVRDNGNGEFVYFKGEPRRVFKSAAGSYWSTKVGEDAKDISAELASMFSF